jgi:lipoyl(octanoyl) transferase
MATRRVVVRELGSRDYDATLAAMQGFTSSRNEETDDEFWLLEHPAVFTLGRGGRTEHLLEPGDIPVVRSDRGGQVTYHGPGQLILYTLTDIDRLQLGIRSFVSVLEDATIRLLAEYGVTAAARKGAPGVYVNERKIASLGLRLRKGRSYHGLSLNVDMDLEPFTRIDPCGYSGLEVTQLRHLGGPTDIRGVGRALCRHLADGLKYDTIEYLIKTDAAR